jgi:hypothetical protein
MADKNDHPEIPSFNPGTDKEEKKGGGILGFGSKAKSPGSLSTGAKAPGALSSGAKPSGGGGFNFPTFGGTKAAAGGMKVRGLPGGSTIVERLKNLRKKDMAFIAAGLSVLMMAPVAEHFMMSPSEESGTLQQGFNERGPLFPDGTTVYEQGTGGFSPGSLLGQGADVITPLNVRDPAALVMGPGATQKPSAGAPIPKVTTPTKKKGGWKDALKQAASKGTRQAVKKSAKLPRPNVKMTGALRGLSALGSLKGGGGPTAKLSAPNASNVPNKARGSDSLTRAQAAPGYRGTARRGPASGGGPESLKAAGQRHGDIFNKGGAANALDTAAKSGVPGGGSGYGSGGPGQDGARKGPGGNSHKDNRSLGESLAFIRAKKEMEKAIDLKWKKKEWREFGRKKMIEEAVYKSAIENLLGKGIFEPMGKAIGQAMGSIFPGGAAPSGVHCGVAGGGSFSKNNDDKSNWVCVPGSPSNQAQNTKDGSTITCTGCMSFGAGAASGSTTTPPPGRTDSAPTNWNGNTPGYDAQIGGADTALGQIASLRARVETFKGTVTSAGSASGRSAEWQAATAAMVTRLDGMLAGLDKLKDATTKIKEGWTNNKTAGTTMRGMLGVSDTQKVNLAYANAQHLEALTKLQAAYAKLVPEAAPSDIGDLKLDLVKGSDDKDLDAALAATTKAHTEDTGGGLVAAQALGGTLDGALDSAEAILMGGGTADLDIQAAEPNINGTLASPTPALTQAQDTRQYAALVGNATTAGSYMALQKEAGALYTSVFNGRGTAETYRTTLVTRRAKVIGATNPTPAAPGPNAVATDFTGSAFASVNDIRPDGSSGTPPAASAGLYTMVNNTGSKGLEGKFTAAHAQLVADSDYDAYKATMLPYKTIIDNMATANTASQGLIDGENRSLMQMEGQLGGST